MRLVPWGDPKICQGCGLEKSADQYYQIKRLSGTGYRTPCKKCINAANKIRSAGKKYKHDPEKGLARRKRWEDKHPGWRTAYGKTYRKYNREIMNRKQRKKYATDPIYKAYVMGYVHKRRAHKLAGGSYTPDEWLELLEFYKHRCLFPGCENTNLTPDHVVPLSKGGTNTIENIQPLCRHHNATKYIDIIDYR